MTNFSLDRQRLLETGVLMAATAAVAWMLHSVPSWGDANAAPSLLATLATVGIVAFLWVSLWRRPLSPAAKRPKGGGAEGEETYRATRPERFVLAAFLAGMPVVYFAQYLTAHAQPGGWLWLELAGILIFATLAVLGVKISPWFLVIGIVAHGLGWDSWHYRNSSYIADWYSTGCLLVDITIGAYAAVRFTGQLRADG